MPALAPEALPWTAPLVPDGPTRPVPESGDDHAGRDDHTSDSDGAADGGDEREPAEEPAPNPVPMLPSLIDVSALLPAARDARDKLISAGRSVSRDALAAQLRADGHAASNTRVSAVLKVLVAAESKDQAAA